MLFPLPFPLQKKILKIFFKAAHYPPFYNLLGHRGFGSSALLTCKKRRCIDRQNGKNQGTPRLGRCKLKQQAMVYEVVYHLTKTIDIGDFMYDNDIKSNR